MTNDTNGHNTIVASYDDDDNDNDNDIALVAWGCFPL